MDNSKTAKNRNNLKAKQEVVEFFDILSQAISNKGLRETKSVLKNFYENGIIMASEPQQCIEAVCREFDIKVMYMLGSRTLTWITAIAKCRITLALTKVPGTATTTSIYKLYKITLNLELKFKTNTT
jgi:hypothetical protein